MPRVLRCTIYETPEVPLTFIVRECDLHETIEQAAADMETAHHGVFVICDIFEVEQAIYDNELSAVHAGTMRLRDSARELDERNMAISFYWNAMHLKKLVPGGGLANPNFAPLSADQVRRVLRQLKRHPDYNNHRMIMFSKDGTAVTT